ncbi:hypothetical protein RUM43_007883 [Polyplax serrata]|uniref:Uncharacterized protein n=1 Tax=Polyplax serrata TaxID=468196 RepID=A0AAN8P6B3_POLSC
MKNCSLKKKERKDGENAVDFPVVKKSKSEMKMANEKRVYTFIKKLAGSREKVEEEEKENARSDLSPGKFVCDLQSEVEPRGRKRIIEVDER